MSNLGKKVLINSVRANELFDEIINDVFSKQENLIDVVSNKEGGFRFTKKGLNTLDELNNQEKINELSKKFLDYDCDFQAKCGCDNQYEGEFFEDEDEEEEQMELPPRAQICEEAAKLINGDRNKSYGDPSINLKAAQVMTNDFLTSYYESGKDMTEKDNAWLNAMQNVFIKLGRIATGEFKKDSYADCIGYLGIAYELALRAQQEKESRDE